MEFFPNLAKTTLWSKVQPCRIVLWNLSKFFFSNKNLLGDTFDEILRRKCLGLSVRRRFGGSTPSRSVVDEVGVGGVVSTVGGDDDSVGIRRNLPSVGTSFGSSSGSRISRLTSWEIKHLGHIFVYYCSNLYL